MPSGVKLRILHSARRMRLLVCVLYGSQHKQRLFLCTLLYYWFCNPDAVCLLRGTNCVPKYNSVILSFKGLRELLVSTYGEPHDVDVYRCCYHSWMLMWTSIFGAFATKCCRTLLLASHVSLSACNNAKNRWLNACEIWYSRMVLKCVDILVVFKIRRQ